MYQRMLTAEQSLKNEHYPYQERWVTITSHVSWYSERLRKLGIYKGYLCFHKLLHLLKLPSLSVNSYVLRKSLQGVCPCWPRSLLWFFGTSLNEWYWGARLRETSWSFGLHVSCGPALHTGCFRSRAVPGAETVSSPQGQWDCARLNVLCWWFPVSVPSLTFAVSVHSPVVITAIAKYFVCLLSEIPLPQLLSVPVVASYVKVGCSR